MLGSHLVRWRSFAATFAVSTFAVLLIIFFNSRACRIGIRINYLICPIKWSCRYQTWTMLASADAVLHSCYCYICRAFRSACHLSDLVYGFTTWFSESALTILYASNMEKFEAWTCLPFLENAFLFLESLSCGCILQVARLDASYPGGLASYIKTARELLADSKAGKNPFDGFTPSVSNDDLIFFSTA